MKLYRAVLLVGAAALTSVLWSGTVSANPLMATSLNGLDEGKAIVHTVSSYGYGHYYGRSYGGYRDYGYRGHYGGYGKGYDRGYKSYTPYYRDSGHYKGGYGYQNYGYRGAYGYQGYGGNYCP